jgi:hypothetical protein
VEYFFCTAIRCLPVTSSVRSVVQYNAQDEPAGHSSEVRPSSYGTVCSGPSRVSLAERWESILGNAPGLGTYRGTGRCMSPVTPHDVLPAYPGAGCKDICHLLCPSCVTGPVCPVSPPPPSNSLCDFHHLCVHVSGSPPNCKLCVLGLASVYRNIITAAFIYNLRLSVGPR